MERLNSKFFICHRKTLNDSMEAAVDYAHKVTRNWYTTKILLLCMSTTPPSHKDILVFNFCLSNKDRSVIIFNKSLMFHFLLCPYLMYIVIFQNNIYVLVIVLENKYTSGQNGKTKQNYNVTAIITSFS